MSVQIYDSSESDTSPLSTDEYDDDDDSDLMDMAVSVKPGPGASNNNISKVRPSGTASSSSTNVMSSSKKVGPRKSAAASRYKKSIQAQPRLNTICKKRSLRWFKNGMKRATARMYLKEFYSNKIQKNGENKIVTPMKSSSVAAAEKEKVRTDLKLKLDEELRYNQQMFLQQHQRALNENLQGQSQQQKQQQKGPPKHEKQERSMMEILKHVQNQERLQTKSPELICLDVTEDEESPQKSEPSPPTPPPISKVDKMPANKHVMQIKIVDIKESIDDVVICPDEEDVVEVETKITNEMATDRNIYEQQIPLLNYPPQVTVTDCNENENVSATEVINVNNNEEVQFLVNANVLSNVNIPGIMEVDTAVDVQADAIVTQNDIIPMQMQMQMKPCVVAEPISTSVGVLPEQQQQHQQMSLKLNSIPSFSNSSSILPHPPQVVTPVAHTPSPIRAPQTTATPQAAHMRSPIVVPSTPSNSVAASSTPITASIKLPPPQIHASNMSVKRRRSTTPDNLKIPTVTATITAQQETSKQGQTSSNLPGISGNTDGDQHTAKKRMLDPTSNKAFYERIQDLIPDYNEAISTRIKGFEQTDDKINGAINRINTDLLVLDNVLKTKEDEWNKLLYLQRVKQELLERMLRMLRVAKAKKRGEMVPKYSLKQLQELEESLEKSIGSSESQLPPPPPQQQQQQQEQQPTERENSETELPEPCEFANSMAQMMNKLANMLPEDLQQHIKEIQAFKKDFLLSDKLHELCKNNNETKLLDETIARQEERIKRQREEEIHRRYLDEKLQEEQRRLRYENQLRYEKQREIEHQRQLEECFGKYPEGVPAEYLINKAKAVAELKARRLPPPPQPSSMLGRQGIARDVKGNIDSYHRENPQTLPPPPLFKFNKPTKPETYVSTNNNYANNYKPSSMSQYDNIPTLKTLGGGGAGGSGVGFPQPRSTREQYEHSGSGMAPMPKPYKPKFDMRYNNASYDDNLRASSSNAYKPTNRHSFGDLEYNRNNYGISNGRDDQLDDHGPVNDDNNENGVCQACYKNKALYICCGCNKVRYCSKPCQDLAWDKHQDVCF